jgi:signal transduction histidine kinase
MTGVAESTTPRLTRRVPIVTGFAIALSVSVVTISAVAAVLLGLPADAREVAVPVFGFGAIVTFGVGLSDLARGREPRFARALVAAGLLWSLSALAASHQPTLYSLGRIGQWFVDLAIVYVLLSYPSGRLTERIDRGLFAAGALLLGLLYVPTALFGQQFPSPAVWSKCISNCPANAFAVGHSTPAFVTDLLIPVREVLTPAMFIAMAVVLTHRASRSGPLLRRMYAPIAVIAITRALVLATYFGVRRANPASEILDALSWLYVVSLPVVVLACSAGRLYRRLFAASALDRVARDVSSSTTPMHVRRALADALRDPSLRILHSFPGDSGEWVDESGSPVPMWPPATGQQMTEIASGSWRIAIAHDPALAEDRALIRTAGSYALAALENNRLNVELSASLRDLAESRALRIVAEESERRKIERDLHDGAQQRLVTMRVKIGLAADQLEGHDPHGADVIRALGEDIDATIDEVRAFARGIYPPLLSRTGLHEALRAVARGAALPTTVHADRLGRYPAEIEATVYFSCSEALQNAAKHARGATGVTIWVWRERRQLHFQVRDDGAGFDLQSTPYGTGLSNLHSRLAAVGGTMTVHSLPGEGSVIGGSIPLR